MAKYDPELDPDSLTDAKLFQENKTWSKGYIMRRKILSHITGTKAPSRRKVFSEIHSTADLRIWTTQVGGKTIPCAKVHNPNLLSKDSSTWTSLANVERLEIEDPEGNLSTIPKHITLELTCLNSFTLTWTKVKTLPPTLFQLPLKSLYLLRNQLKTVNGIEKADQLTILDISNNRIDSLPKTFGQLVNLVTLNVSNNELKELPDSIGTLNCLKTFDCSCNKLKILPDSIRNMIGLESLDVCNNQLASLPAGIGNLPCLGDLRARSNLLYCLPEDFGQLIELHSLLLRKNRFIEVPVQLRTLPKLQSLNMRDNSIRRMDISISSLQTLVLDSNEFTGIDNGILHCKNLQLLSLNNNKIDAITSDIKRMHSLKSLSLAENNITEVPDALGKMDNLKNLNLAKLKMSRLPKSVVFMTSLTTLDLTECTELDRYLMIEYNKNGLEGVRNYLKENKNQELDPYERVDVDIPDSGAQNHTVVKPSPRDTIMPIDFQEDLPNYEEIKDNSDVKLRHLGERTEIKKSDRETLDVESIYVNSDQTDPPHQSNRNVVRKLSDEIQDNSRQSIYPDGNYAPIDDDLFDFERNNTRDKLNQHRNRPESISLQPEIGRQMSENMKKANFKTELEKRLLGSASGIRSPTLNPDESSSTDTDVVEYAVVDRTKKNAAATKNGLLRSPAKQDEFNGTGGGYETSGVAVVKAGPATFKKPSMSTEGDSTRTTRQPPSIKSKPPTASKPPNLTAIDEHRNSFDD